MKKLTSILLIIIMLFTATSFTGCTNPTSPLRVRMSASSETFPIDNAVIDLEYGFHVLTFLGTPSKNPREEYPLMGYPEVSDSTRIEFGIYLRYRTKENCFDEYDYYKIYNIKDHILLKWVSQEEAFSKEYGYRHRPWGSPFRHKEQVVIPPEYFDGEGEPEIIFVTFYFDAEDRGSIPSIEDIVTKSIYYTIIDESTVKISF